MLTKQTIILNTLADNAADFFVGTRGLLRITGSKVGLIDTSRARVSITPSVAEVLGVRTITFTAGTAGTVYQLSVSGGNALEGNYTPKTLSLTLTQTANDTATTLATAFKDWVNSNSTNLQITATSSAGVLTLTGKTDFPIVQATSTTSSSLVSIVATTNGVSAVGSGTDLQTDPNYNTTTVYGSFTAGATYTRIEIDYNYDNQASAAANNTTNAENTVYVFINEAATSSGSDNAVVNRALILNSSYGTAYLLAQGLRAVAPTTAASTTAAVTATTGAIALASGSVTFASLGAESGDYLVINTGTTFSTIDSTKITGITGVAAGFGTNVTGISAGSFKHIAVRALPKGI